MPRYVAFLRGVSPLNCKMPELKRCFEGVGFSNVKTLLSSGNVVFDTVLQTDAQVELLAEQGMEQGLDRVFRTIARSVTSLEALLATDPYTEHGIPVEAKRVVSFLREVREPKVVLPLAADNASVFCLRGREAYTAYLPSEKGPVFMKLIEDAFGTEVTTRTWDTIRKCAAA
ncbi:MAG: DUF1697 domain-containing protein [Paucibacter sp.]|nr:DUF1697 domain-containing protein [Roseateles sp.]